MKTLFLCQGLRLTCPTYPGDVITAVAGSVIHVTFCFEGLDDDELPLFSQNAVFNKNCVLTYLSAEYLYYN